MAYKPKVLAVADGGTGAVTLTDHGVLVGSGTSAVSATAAGSAGQVLQSGGASANPVYSTATFPATATSTGTILRADGTNWAATTSTYPNTNAVNTVLYASSANVMAALPTANSAVLATNGSGVPSITATPSITSITLSAGTALSTYIQGTFTPVLNFGGGTTGITYTTQVAQYTRIGNLVFFTININLSSKGSSTGTANITGFPVSAGSNFFNNVVSNYQNFTFTVGYSLLQLQISGGTSANLPQQGSALGPTVATDVNFANNTVIFLTGFYAT